MGEGILMRCKKIISDFVMPGIGQAGFTLVETIVVTAVFVIVIIIASDSFNRILTQSNILTKRMESNIEGIVGLEMLRHDLNQAGFGLPWGYTNPINYTEASGTEESKYNDASSGIPRAFLAGDNVAGSDKSQPDKTDYLVLKGTSLSRNIASQKWTYVSYSSVGSSKPKVWSSGNLKDGDTVTVIRRAFTESGFVNQLVVLATGTGANTFSTSFSSGGLGAGSGFEPVLQQETHYLYGIDSGTILRPFNRSDYYVRRPETIPSMCADRTGVLYKATLNQSSGTFTEIPILDCVADMQVVFGWDMNEDGVIDTVSNADGTTANSSAGFSNTHVKDTIKDAGLIRNRLKLVKIYLLVQDGRPDPNYKNTKDIIVGNKNLGEESLTKKYTVTDIEANKWSHYRWKVYRIVVDPKNLTLQ